MGVGERGRGGRKEGGREGGREGGWEGGSEGGRGAREGGRREGGKEEGKEIGSKKGKHQYHISHRYMYVVHFTYCIHVCIYQPSSEKGLTYTCI